MTSRISSSSAPRLMMICAAVFILSVAAQLTYAVPGDLYASDRQSGNIFKFTPGGTQSTFASGLLNPSGLAFEPAPAGVPDGGATLLFLAMSTLGLVWVRRMVKA